MKKLVRTIGGFIARLRLFMFGPRPGQRARRRSITSSPRSAAQYGYRFPPRGGLRNHFIFFFFFSFFFFFFYFLFFFFFFPPGLQD